MADEYDEREEELSTIAAIFPELVVDSKNPYAARIELAVAPSAPLAVHFLSAAPPPSLPNLDHGKLLGNNETDGNSTHVAADVHDLHHLPPLRLDVVLPKGYPEDKAPEVTLATNPEWLSTDKLRQLAKHVETLWEDYGRCQILFSYIDHLQQAAERAFDLLDSGLDLSPTLKPALLDFDTKTKKAVFDAQTFDCGICLEPKKGSECYRLNKCSHVFCRPCLQDSYTNYIQEGDIVRIRCLDPTCGEAKSKKKKGNKTLHPTELLEMSIPGPTVRRYVDMKRKKKLEADKTTIYCPRSWCQAPARSKKYPAIPVDLRECPESEEEASDDEDGDNNKSTSGTADRLQICSNPACGLAFCRVCYSGWHGDFARCWPRDASELTEEEKASYDYIRTHTSPCPECNTPVQKTHGCNHMTCFQCQTHFCYLCGFWLDGSNPYSHFNKPGTCYQKLWELEEGDDGAENPFVGPRFWEIEALRVAEEADRAEAERLQNEENERGVLMDAEDEVGLDVPIENFLPMLNGGNILPEAPEPPGQGAQGFHHHGLQAPVPRNVLYERRPAGRPRQPNPNLPQLEGGVGRGRGAGRGVGRGRGAGLDRTGGRDGAPAQALAAPEVEEEEAPDEDRFAEALRGFVELAVNDREEEWDSDDLGDEDDGQWQLGAMGPRVRHGLDRS